MGSEKGLELFWEKNQGTINPEQCCMRIVPMMADVQSETWQLLLMQDNAPPHSSIMTPTKLRSRSNSTHEWPPSFPDLNPIESTWSKMKYFIQEKYPDMDGGKQRPHRKNCEIVEDASGSVITEDLINLLYAT